MADTPTSTTTRTSRKATTKTTAKATTRTTSKAGPPRSARGKDLVVVESPAKARTIGQFLGDGYVVEASVGHIRDLPTWGLGVAVDKGFAPKYEVPKDKKDVIARLTKQASQAKAIYLATDPDREGEAISWHLKEAMDLDNLGKPVHRVVFHEITKPAIDEAFAHARDIDLRLVDAQQARRILDRLIGYKLSPLVSKKIRKGKLAAGRVQSVAVRLLVQREREIGAFRAVEYWTVELDLAKQSVKPRTRKSTFRARYLGDFGQKPLPVSGDEKIPPALPDGPAAGQIKELLEAPATTFRVAEVKKGQQTRKPQAPFTTSTFQQEAGRKLGYTATRAMAAAQKLYEGVDLGSGEVSGLITYMRTDSTNVSREAQQEALAFIRERYSPSHAPKSPNVYGKKAKGAQEAHEAIRPTSVRRTPDQVKALLGASSSEAKVYELVWQRFVASQMAPAIMDTVTVDVEARTPSRPLLLRASGSQQVFAGFRAVYQEGRDDDVVEDEDAILPDLSAEEALDLVPPVAAEQHFTQPPPRYTEASLIKALEERGIGRPSTYAPTIQAITTRGYVDKDGRRLTPTELGMEVNDLLEVHFPDIVNPDFTAGMEERLDDIAQGERPMTPVLEDFWVPFETSLKKADEAIEIPPVEQVVDEETGEIEACEKCGRPMLWRYSKYGRFKGCSGFPKCRNAIFPKREEVSTGVTCPSCHQGTLVEKRQRAGKRKLFYGCNRYPDCEYISNDKPVPEPCPKCQGMVVIVKAGLKCTQCGDVRTAAEGAPGEASTVTEEAPVPA